MTLVKEGFNQADIEADMAWMAKTGTGWYAPPARNDPPDFASWLETPEGRQWLEEQANIAVLRSDPYHLGNNL